MACTCRASNNLSGWGVIDRLQECGIDRLSRQCSSGEGNDLIGYRFLLTIPRIPGPVQPASVDFLDAKEAR